MDISATQLSSITDKVIPAMNEWRTRSLQSVYPFVYLDCMHYKVRESGRVVTRAIYNILGVDIEGKKDLIGMYVSETEGAKFWLSVITDLKNRGVEDILIACIDGLKSDRRSGLSRSHCDSLSTDPNSDLCSSSNS